MQMTLATIALVAATTLATPIQATPTAPSPAQPPFTPTLLEHDAYSETFTTIADLNDGTYLQLQIAISNIGPGHHRGACRLLLSRPQHPQHSENHTVGKTKWRPLTAPQPGLQVGPCRITHSPTATHIDAQLESHAVLMTLNAPPTPQPAPQHPITVNGDGGPASKSSKAKHSQSTNFYHSDIYVPFSTAEVTLLDHRVFQSEPITLTGSGYMDHSRANTLPAEIATGWLRFRALAPNACATLLLARYTNPNATQATTAYAAAAHEPAAATNPPTANTPPSPTTPSLQAVQAHGALPSVSVLHRQEAFTVQVNQTPWTVQPIRLLTKSDPLENYGFMGRVIRSLVGVPITWTARASLKIPGHPCQPIPGILELTHVQAS